MIGMHPDNMELLKGCIPTAKIGDLTIPVASIEIKVDPSFPKTRKTGRLIWQKDPFVTYEDSDRQWGLAFGFCTEEEEPVTFVLHTFEPVEIEAEFTFADCFNDILADICKSFAVPERLIIGPARRLF